MKYYIIAGEASGDLHGSKLIQEIKKNDPESNFRLWGGDLMSKSGGKVVKSLEELSFMGFYEILINIFTVFKNLSFCKIVILLRLKSLRFCLKGSFQDRSTLLSAPRTMDQFQ